MNTATLTEVSYRPRFADYLELCKPRLSFLALVMAAIGYRTGGNLDGEWMRFTFTLVGLGLLAGGSGALNQYLERETDKLMRRTRNRPLPTGRLTPESVLTFGALTSFAGFFTLLIAANSLTAVLGAMTLLFYLGIYTPAKRVSSLSTLVGAIPGAMPPLMGWTAATGRMGGYGIVLFAVIFLWQIPHFLAIAWMYREDYANGDFPVLTVLDRDGQWTAWWGAIYALALIPVSLIPPVFWGLSGPLYFWSALTLGLIFFGLSVRLARQRTVAAARTLFFGSLLYLPLWGSILIWDIAG